jgi:hypothetical protein
VKLLDRVWEPRSRNPSTQNQRLIKQAGAEDAAPN